MVSYPRFTQRRQDSHDGGVTTLRIFHHRYPAENYKKARASRARHTHCHVGFIESAAGYSAQATRDGSVAVYFNGFIEEVDRYQSQWSQEFRFTGTAENIDWVAGVYHFEEDTDEAIKTLFSLDLFGIVTGVPLTPFSPPTDIDHLVTGLVSPQRRMLANTSVSALYGTLTWVPDAFNQALKTDVGFRYSKEKKSGQRVAGGIGDFDIGSENLDPSISLAYQWRDDVSTYVKWSTAYRSGGVNSRSATLTPFDEERVSTTEIGLKSEWLDPDAPSRRFSNGRLYL